MRIVGLMGVKKNSSLPKKGYRDFGGKPMFQWNLEKGLKLDEMYVTSDYDFVLREAEKLGAKTIKREDPYLMECPNIIYYKYCMPFMGNPDAFIAIQVNSPTVNFKLIEITKKLLEIGVQEIITIFPDKEIYGSIWAMTRERLENYQDPYNPSAEVLIIDPSIDIHSKSDLFEAIKQL